MGNILVIIGMSNKLLFCAKIYTFIFEHDVWLLYKKAKKQGIQHYLNAYHLKQFGTKWEEFKEKYTIINDDFSKLDDNTSNIMISKFDKLAEEYHYKEYHDVTEIINSNDVVLVGEVFSIIQTGYASTRSNIVLYNKLMIEDIIKKHDAYVFKVLLENPQQVISF